MPTKPKRTLAPEALYHSNKFDTIRQHGDASPRYIPGIEHAAERMRELDPDGSRTRELLRAVRAGEWTVTPSLAQEDRTKTLLDTIEPQ
jgi:hypothetical protein